MSLEKLEALLGDGLLRDEPLARYTAARIGGPAELLYVAEDTPTLIDVVQTAWDLKIPVRLLGGGANVLVSDGGVCGLVIVNRVKSVVFIHEVDSDYQQLDKLSGDVNVSAGMSLTRLANECASKGLTGFEWAVSVPGTVGGAVVNNAGAHGADMSDAVRNVSVLDRVAQEMILMSANKMKFAYRSTVLKGIAAERYVVLGASLHFKHDDPTAIRARMNEYRAHRKRTQPPGASLGSIFKNPDGDYAGRLVEAAGLKGQTIGGAAVSEKHANFFINTGGATATDYAALVRHVQREVEARFGVRLETEIEMIGEGF